jgi:hypothetical protein
MRVIKPLRRLAITRISNTPDRDHVKLLWRDRIDVSSKPDHDRVRREICAVGSG